MADASEQTRVTIDDVIARSGLKRAEVYRHVKDGKLAGTKTNGAMTFAEADVAALVASIETTRTGFVEAARALHAFLCERLGEDDRTPAPEDETDEAAWTAAVVGVLLALATADGASHLHVDPVDDEDRLLVRKDGMLRELVTIDRALADRIRAKLKADAKAAGEGTVRGKLAIKTPEGAPPVTGHLTGLPSAQGEHVHVAFRERRSDRSLADLGYTDAQADAVDAVLGGPPGLFLAVGPGDPADEAHRVALASRLAHRGRLVVSIDREDGLRDPSLVQLHYGVDEEGVPSFAQVFDSALSTRPDVIVIDSIDEPERAVAAIRAAQAGALVIGQVVTSDFTWALRRLAEAGLPAARLAPFLAGATVRRSLRRLCPECAQPVDADAALPPGVTVDADAALPPGVTEARAPVGCEHCHDGFAGKLSVFGLVRASGDVVNALTSAEPDLKTFGAPEDPDVGLRTGVAAALKAGRVHADDVTHLL